MVYKYIKNRIFIFITLIAVCVSIVYIPDKLNHTEAKKKETISTCWLACFIDDTNYSYKSQVIYSGEQLEGTRIGRFLPWANPDGDLGFNRSLEDDDEYPSYYAGRQSCLLLDTENDRVPIMGLKNEETGFYVNQNSGEIVIDASNITNLGMHYSNISDVDFSNYGGFHTPRAMSFPTMKNSANASDINRAYEIQDALVSDFMEALIFVNDGQSFNSVRTLQETAYSILTASDDAVLTNQFGNQYIIDYNNGDSSYSAGYPKQDNGYAYYIKITDTDSKRSEEFCYKVKKGYVGCQNGDIMENGTVNNLRMDEAYTNTDTTFISWEHIYIEAGLLYAENISYANQGDLFNMDEAESVVTKIFRNLLNGLTSSLQLYSIEDCIFNSGVRGSRAFTFGVYYDSWSYFIFLIYLIFMVIAIALITLAVIRIIIKKLEGTISPASRYSMVEGIKDLIISLFIICILWILIKFILMLNYRFVSIWRDYVNGKSLADNASNISSLAGVAYRFIFFIIRIYVNYIYILRGLVVPALIVTAPLFIIVSAFGVTGKKVTGQWIRELLGNVFMQSIHAFIYGFILMASVSLRGIEAVVICASIIPLTAVFKNVMQIGGDEILKTARGLTGATAVAGAGVVSAGANAIGGISEGIGQVAKGFSPEGKIASGISFATKTAGGLVSAGGGLYQAGMGVGLSGAMGDGSGNGMISSGLNSTGRELGGILKSGGKDLGNVFRPRSNEEKGDIAFNKVIKDLCSKDKGLGLKNPEISFNNGKRQAFFKANSSLGATDLHNRLSYLQKNGMDTSSFINDKFGFGFADNFDVKATENGISIAERGAGKLIKPFEASNNNASSTGKGNSSNHIPEKMKLHKTFTAEEIKDNVPLTIRSNVEAFQSEHKFSAPVYGTNQDGKLMSVFKREDNTGNKDYERLSNKIIDFSQKEGEEQAKAFSSFKTENNLSQNDKVFVDEDGFKILHDVN